MIHYVNPNLFYAHNPVALKRLLISAIHEYCKRPAIRKSDTAAV